MRYRFTTYHPVDDADATAAGATGATRLGGQPDWTGEPQWPVYWHDGEPASFVGQFRVPASDGDGAAGDRTVYLFAAGFSGEYATVVQPGGQVTKRFETRTEATGPTVIDRAHLVRVAEEVDFSQVERDLEPVEDEDEDDREVRLEERLDDLKKGATGGIRMDQLGGPDVAPIWLQDEHLPGEDWQFVAQLDSYRLPFPVNFGDSGVGYLFIAPDGSSAEFLFQSS